MLHAPKSHGAFLIHMKEVYNTCISKSVHVYRDYTLEVEFNVSFDEFRKLSADTKISAAKEPKHMPGQNKKAGLQNCKPAFGGLEEIR